MHLARNHWLKCLATAIAFTFCATPAWAQYGPILTGAGPINRSMSGTSTATPIDATGALYWNSATITALPGSSLDFGMELLLLRTELSSTLPASSFGPGLPPVTLAGSTQADNGVFALPSVGLVYQPEDSRFTYGLGLFPVAGFGVNYSASTTNPILTPQAPNGFGLGSLWSELQVLQIAPTIAFQITDRLSIGLGPTVNLANLRVDPLLVAAPDNANGDAFATYARGGNHTHTHWGAGFQVGLYYALENGWSVGTSFKSPQWFEDFQFHAVDELGRPRDDSATLELPWILSVGIGYSGLERWTFGVDARYLDFNNAAGFGDQGYAPTGAVRGLGFESIFTVSTGVEFRVTEALTARMGYSFGDNPIRDSQSIFNVASPTIIEHTLSVGASYRISDAFTLSASYLHSFENAIDGPLVLPVATIPGSSIRSTTSVNMFLIGATVNFGPRQRSFPLSPYEEIAATQEVPR